MVKVVVERMVVSYERMLRRRGVVGRLRLGLYDRKRARKEGRKKRSVRDELAPSFPYPVLKASLLFLEEAEILLT